MPATPPASALYYGGQAVLEGVMIRGPEHMAVAVRHPRGHIVTHVEKLGGVYTGVARRLPLVRGVVVLWETMALGMRALSFSSRVAVEGDGDGQDEPAEFPESVFWGMMALSLVFVVAVFFASPILLANLLSAFDVSHWIIVGVEGVVRLGLFIGYILLIGLIPDIQRVFQYHGAEHMTIHAHENGAELDTRSILTYPKEHTRCGTSFLLVVVFVAILVFFSFDVLVDEGLLVRILSRIVLVPPIAALSYEILRLGARFGDRVVVRMMFAPNLALQVLTTRTPDESQVEVALASFQAVLTAASTSEPAGV